MRCYSFFLKLYPVTSNINPLAVCHPPAPSHRNEHENETLIDNNDGLACVAAHTGLSLEDMASPTPTQLSQIYAKFTHIVDDLEVAKMRLVKSGDQRSLSRFQDQTKHCVRCHKKYRIWLDGPSACHIKHDDRIDVEEGDRDARYYRQEWIYPCNGESVWLSEDDSELPGHSYCYIGPHANDPSDVHYTDDIWREKGLITGPKDLEGKSAQALEEEFGPRMFPTCEQAGCNIEESELHVGKRISTAGDENNGGSKRLRV